MEESKKNKLSKSVEQVKTKAKTSNDQRKTDGTLFESYIREIFSNYAKKKNYLIKHKQKYYYEGNHFEPDYELVYGGNSFVFDAKLSW